MTKTKPAWVLATWYGCGYWPWGPGTAGSLAAILIAWPLSARAGFGPWHFLILSLVLLWPSIIAAGLVARESARKDPQIVVVDEVLGQWITLVGAMRFDWISLALAFGLFRLFDIWKPFPVRKLESIPGGAGIILDDIGAGIYGAVVLFLIERFLR
jgi:phosphatidylglycerophosphatase A